MRNGALVLLARRKIGLLSPHEGFGQRADSFRLVGHREHEIAEADPQPQRDNQSRKKAGQPSYNANSPYQVLGVGALTEGDVEGLVAEKQQRTGVR
jgi:hypothetical protein